MPEARFKLEKETKGAYQFKEIEEPGKPLLSGTIYAKKHIFNKKPNIIKVSIEAEE